MKEVLKVEMLAPFGDEEEEVPLAPLAPLIQKKPALSPKKLKPPTSKDTGCTFNPDEDKEPEAKVPETAERLDQLAQGIMEKDDSFFKKEPEIEVDAPAYANDHTPEKDQANDEECKSKASLSDLG
eukprot:CAMPEP_0185598356 /NCGR_PEP_ID=MMETSP0434-20130131/81936_1 /TAXON_ID=626734 ORGANISM="Favella taraikaensis, Strain Fe Narragansett Bay" /NCGR_SAMPLE_ID=MMETSP0434 /ASSEMBLY_ACC=CAM_ASM_000379 /LENGTH=125 /DNA_ID=CAMNT_0028227303 /DNA_START=236 /DNA_END=613 /DNA_ORIENTATION=-